MIIDDNNDDNAPADVDAVMETVTRLSKNKQCMCFWSMSIFKRQVLNTSWLITVIDFRHCFVIHDLQNSVYFFLPSHLKSELNSGFSLLHSTWLNIGLNRKVRLTKHQYTCFVLWFSFNAYGKNAFHAFQLKCKISKCISRLLAQMQNLSLSLSTKYVCSTLMSFITVIAVYGLNKKCPVLSSLKPRR